MPPDTPAAGPHAPILRGRRLALLGAFGLVAAARLASDPPAAPAGAGADEAALDALERAVFRHRPLPEMAAGTLARRLAAGGHALRLFDVREAAEYASGHIAGAIRLAPDMPGWAFARLHGGGLGGAELVFCSVAGIRSGRMLAQTFRALQGLPKPYAVFNLRGGLLRWQAEGRPLVAPDGRPAAGPAADPATLLRRLRAEAGG